MDAFDALNNQGIEVLGVVAGFLGHDRAWLEHIVHEQLILRNECGCTVMGGEPHKSCRKWETVERYKKAEAEFERAKNKFESIKSDLERLT